jgi:hypothetical protein
MLTRANRSGNVGDPDESFRPQAVSRLYLAIVNRAILDLVENGKNSPAAKRWLLSRNFGRLQELFRSKIPNTLEVTEGASTASPIQLRKCLEEQPALDAQSGDRIDDKIEATIKSHRRETIGHSRTRPVVGGGVSQIG